MMKGLYSLNDEARKGGRAAFLWRYGVLRFGIPVGVVSALMTHSELYGLTSDSIRSWRFVSLLIANIAGMSIAGALIFGRSMWRLGRGDKQESNRRDRS
jgi:hypothetical protein